MGKRRYDAYGEWCQQCSDLPKREYNSNLEDDRRRRIDQNLYIQGNGKRQGSTHDDLSTGDECQYST
jgi:hypothetical protein